MEKNLDDEVIDVELKEMKLDPQDVEEEMNILELNRAISINKKKKSQEEINNDKIEKGGNLSDSGENLKLKKSSKLENFLKKVKKNKRISIIILEIQFFFEWNEMKWIF